MTGEKRCLQKILRHPWWFLGKAIAGFNHNHGLLLSGAVAYYLLLSIIPLFTLTLITLSYFANETDLLYIMKEYLEIVLPSSADALTVQVEIFLDNRQMIGFVGIGILLFFSSLAFTALEKAMCVIFQHHDQTQRRHFLVTFLIPYVFILVLGLGVLLVSVITGLIKTLEPGTLAFIGITWSLDGFIGSILYLFGVLGLMLLLTALYLVMPVGKIDWQHALIGGITAGLLWEMTRHLLFWYFTNLSVVDVIYGSLATAIVTLISFEIAAIILLFGAQVIAEFEKMVLASSASGAEATS
jgi:membrane protein